MMTAAKMTTKIRIKPENSETGIIKRKITYENPQRSDGEFQTKNPGKVQKKKDITAGGFNLKQQGTFAK